MNQKISKSANSLQEALNKAGLICKILELPESTRTAKDAATSIGCEEACIVKSLIFQTKNTHEPVLVLASGPNRIDEEKIATYVGEGIEKASAEFVRKITGFAIGGVAPLGHATPIGHVFMDEDLLSFADVWAAAGTPRSVFCTQSKRLASVTKAQIVSVKVRQDI